MKIIVSTFLLFLLLIAAPANAEHISFIGGQIPYVFHSEKRGPHNIFFDKMMAKNQGTHDITYMPYRRALRLFNAGKSDCIFVATDKASDYPREAVEAGQILFSRPINEIRLRAYSLKGRPTIASREDLKGRVVAGAKSHIKSLKARLPQIENMSFITTETHVKAFELMNRGRVDVVLAYEQDEVQLKNQMFKGAYSFSPTFVVESRNEVMACWKNEITVEFITMVNTMIDKPETLGN